MEQQNDKTTESNEQKAVGAEQSETLGDLEPLQETQDNVQGGVRGNTYRGTTTVDNS